MCALRKKIEYDGGTIYRFESGVIAFARIMRLIIIEERDVGEEEGRGKKVVWSNVVTTRSEEFRLNFEKFSFLARPVLKGISLRVERTTKYDSASSTRFCTAREKDVFSKISRSNREI